MVSCFDGNKDITIINYPPNIASFSTKVNNRYISVYKIIPFLSKTRLEVSDHIFPVIL